jgi:hypothetical protein
MATDIKRSEFKTFMNTTPTTTETWNLVGDGVTTGTVNMNPQTTEETFIHQDGASISIDRYAPTYPLEGKAKKGDAVFDFVDGLRKSRATLTDAETEFVNVWLYESPTGGAYPAEKQNVSIQIDSWGGDGGQATRINYTINYIGDPVLGTFNPTTKTFTAA